MRILQTKIVEKVKTHFVFNTYIYFFFENHVVCKVMWENMAEPDRPQMTT